MDGLAITSLRVKFGLFGININACADDVGGIAALAEDSGWESVWTGEHYALPDPPAMDFPSDVVFLDPFIALGMAAARTRNLLLAPRSRSCRYISRSRWRNGSPPSTGSAVADSCWGWEIGYLEAEFEALGVPFDHRAGRTMDHLAAMRAIWAGETLSPEGSSPIQGSAPSLGRSPFHCISAATRTRLSSARPSTARVDRL